MKMRIKKYEYTSKAVQYEDGIIRLGVHKTKTGIIAEYRRIFNDRITIELNFYDHDRCLDVGEHWGLWIALMEFIEPTRTKVINFMTINRRN